MAGGAETPNIAALPAIARLGTCESARGPDADRHVELLSQFAVEGSLSGAYSHLSCGRACHVTSSPRLMRGKRTAARGAKRPFAGMFSVKVGGTGSESCSSLRALGKTGLTR
jgi:hypothetical protein